MNKRQKNKLKKREYASYIYEIDIASKIKEDSIAYLVKSYFELDSIHNKELFKYDDDTKKILVSKKALNHLLKLCGAELLEHNFDFELVDDIKVLYD